MALSDWCLLCQRPESEHTPGELEVCWELLGLGADIADEQRVMGTCLLCDERMLASQLLDHIRVLHPDQYGDGPERWPDGSFVTYEDADMEDFDHGD